MRVIVNPRAGRGVGAQWTALLEKRVRLGGENPEVRITEGPGHATELTRQALADGERVIVVAGGDGTLGEAAQAMQGSDASLGIIPLGTGNDFARSLGLPRRNVDAALKVVERGFTRCVDVAVDGERRFVSVLGLGFPAAVALRANRYRYLRGTLAFACAVYAEIRTMSPFRARIRLDDELPFEAVVTSILIQNTPTTGGGMWTAPAADVSDGYLEVLLVDDIGRMSLTWNFPKVYLGRHLTHPSFRSYRCRTVAVDCPSRVGKMGDGEAWGWSPAEVRVEPQALRVFVDPQEHGHP